MRKRSGSDGESSLPEWHGKFILADRKHPDMKHVRVVVSAHGHEAAVHPMFDLLSTASFVERATALQWNVSDDALGILHHVEGDVDAFAAALDSVDQVVDYDLEPVGKEAFYAYIIDTLTDTSLAVFEAFARAGVVVVPPIVYHGDGRTTLSVFGPAEALRETVDAIEAAGPPVSVDVEGVGSLTGVVSTPGTRLSDRQREAAEAALDLGYYEVPRTASQADVAAALDCAPSTAAEHLRKAEAKVMRSAIGR